MARSVFFCSAQITVVERVKVELEHLALEPRRCQHFERLFPTPHHAQPGAAMVEPLMRNAVSKARV
jgi:hypothetical protein